MWTQLLFYVALIGLSGLAGYQIALLRFRRLMWKDEQEKLLRKKKSAEKAANKRRAAALQKIGNQDQSRYDPARNANGISSNFFGEKQ